MKQVSIEELLGKTCTSVTQEMSARDGEQLFFRCTDGTEYCMYHEQDCCEGVWLEDICGDLSDLVGSPLVEAEEDCAWGSEDRPDLKNPPVKEHVDNTYTWTFYKLRTAKGCVTLRWFGSSNGYYSEDVSIYEVSKGDRDED